MGGALLGGGLPGAVVGAAFGTIYGSTQGMYKAMTGEGYTPDSFRDKVEMQQYFDMIEYQRSQQMYEATGDKSWRKQMIQNPYGWIESGGGQAFNIQPPMSSMAYMGRSRNEAYNTLMSPDRGFRSPYGGQDSQRSLNYDAESVNIYSGFSALPSWDRPYWTAFLDTPEDERENVLNLVDKTMGDMLQVAWGKGEDIAMPNMDAYFNSKFKPSALHPVMDPTTNLSDWQVQTVENEGLNAHDFGMGWREQMQRINSDPYGMVPLEYNKPQNTGIIRNNLSNAEIRDAISKILGRMGYEGATIVVRSTNSTVPETNVVLNVNRTTEQELLDSYYGD